MYTKGISTLSNKWDIRFLELAKGIAGWSKDPSRKIGAIAVDDRSVVAQGYNGFPRGIEDYAERYEDRDLKYKLVVHAEMNVIYNATYNGVSLDGATLYVWGLPVCSECAKGVIQTGIRRVVMPKQDIPDHWTESWKLTQTMFEEANIEWEFIDVSDTGMDQRTI
jgi:dCMP deaminase